MKEKPNIFQIALIGSFAVMIILGFMAFSDKLPFLPKGTEALNYGDIVVWGTLPQGVVDDILQKQLAAQKVVSIKYIQKKEATFDQDFVEALANGTGPDAFLLRQDKILKMLGKISLIPYETVTENDFKTSFVQEGELFLRPGGIAAIPVAIDPLVMYWNRDLFTNASLVAPPTKWSQFYSLVPALTVRNQSGAITQSLVAFGGYENVTNAKDVISMLIMQAGKPLVTSINGVERTDIAGESNDQGPAALSLNFFSEFSRSDKTSYSWNRALPASRSMFEGGDLALYFGYASEYKDIQAKNPHLNFAVTMVPQVEQSSQKLTFGRVTGFAVTKASQNIPGATYAAQLFSLPEVVTALATGLGTPPVRRDLLATPPGSGPAPVFYNSAIIARAWLDPSPQDTDPLFATMINSINSGRFKVSDALYVFEAGIGKLLAR